MIFYITGSLALCSLALASCAPHSQSPSIEAGIRQRKRVNCLHMILKIKESEVPSLLSIAHATLQFQNSGQGIIVLPIHDFAVNRNIFLALYDRNSPFLRSDAAAEMGVAVPIFQTPPEGYVVLNPGEHVDYPISGLPWSAFEWAEPGQELHQVGTFKMEAYFTGGYASTLSYVPDELIGKVWREPIRSNVATLRALHRVPNQ